MRARNVLVKFYRLFSASSRYLLYSERCNCGRKRISRDASKSSRHSLSNFSVLRPIAHRVVNNTGYLFAISSPTRFIVSRDPDSISLCSLRVIKTGRNVRGLQIAAVFLSSIRDERLPTVSRWTLIIVVVFIIFEETLFTPFVEFYQSQRASLKLVSFFWSFLNICWIFFFFLFELATASE